MTTLLLAALCIATLIAAAIILYLVTLASKSTADFDGTEYDEPKKPSQHPIWRDEQ